MENFPRYVDSTRHYIDGTRERLGGLAPISVVVSDFLDILVPDPVRNANPAIDAARKRVPAAYLKYQVTAIVCETTGGPCTYHGAACRNPTRT